MNDPGRQTGETEFERNARAMFDASIESLDARTLSKLNHARHRALQAAAVSRPGHRPWGYWAPLGVLAASVVAVALLLRGPGSEPAPSSSAQLPVVPEAEAVELLAAGEDLELATEADLDFYAWVAAADSAASSGIGG
jgi:hypothetical protein